MGDEEIEEPGDPSVPPELIDLHLDLEEAEMTPEEFKEVFGAEDRKQS